MVGGGHIVSRLVKCSYGQIKNKIRDLRYKHYKQVEDSETRSGSGRMVLDNYEILQEIWCGFSSVTMSSGACSSSLT